MYYQDENDIYVNLYFDSDASFKVNGNNVKLMQRRDPLTGSFHLSSTSNGKQTVNRTAAEYPNNPDTLQVFIQVETDSDNVPLNINVRIPWWITEAATVELNNKLVASQTTGGTFVSVNENFNNGDVICVTMKMGITTCGLPDDENMVAFMYGPEVLAGLCDDERTLYSHGKPFESILVHENEREWGSWKNDFKTTGQPAGIHFIPLNRIGYENYCVYFPVEK